MTREQMICTIADANVVKAIGEDHARAIFDHLMSRKSPSGSILVYVASLRDTIGEDKARAIFDELMSY